MTIRMKFKWSLKIIIHNKQTKTQGKFINRFRFYVQKIFLVPNSQNFHIKSHVKTHRVMIIINTLFIIIITFK